jgi:hypothetical protein
MSHQYPSFLGSSPASPPALAMLASILLVLVLDVALIRYCLDDLNRHVIVNGDRLVWTAVIILGGPVGQIFYWLYGRGEY